MPKFGDYFFALFFGLCGIVVFTVVSLVLWFLSILLGLAPKSSETSADIFTIFWLIGSLLFFILSARFSWNVGKAERSCSACNAQWTIQPTGESQVLETEEVWRQEERSEKKYKRDLRPSGWYARSVFLDVLYEVDSLEDAYKCSNCSAVTKQPRTVERKLCEEVKSATPWQPAQSDAEIGAKIGRKMV